MKLTRGEFVGLAYANDDELREFTEEILAENDRLRELLQDLAICACGKYCYGCPHQYDGCNRDQRLRELGIEVDE